MAARLGLRARRIAIEPGPEAYLLGFSLLGPANKDWFAGAHGEFPEMAKPFDGGVGYHPSRRPNVRSVTQEKNFLTPDGFIGRRRIAYWACRTT
jgi:hypothetical protein